MLKPIMYNIRIHLKSFFNNQTINMRLSLFLLTMSLVITFYSVCIAKINVRVLDREYLNQYLQSEQAIVSDNILLYLEEIILNSLSYKNNTVFYDILDNTSLPYEQKKHLLWEEAARIHTSDSISITSIYINDASGKCFLLKGDASLPWPDSELLHVKEGNPYYHIGRPVQSSNGNYYVPVGMRLYNFSSSVDGGQLIVYLPQESIVNLFSRLSDINSNSVFLANQDGIILAQTNALNIGQTIENLGMSLPSDSFSMQDISYEDSRYLAVSSIIKNQQMNLTLYLVSLIPATDSFHILVKIQEQLYIIVLIISLISLLISSHLSAQLSRSVERLRDNIHKLGQGDFNAVIDTCPSNELQELEQGYNDMVIRIHDLLEKIRQEQHEKSVLEYTALTAQINPHFLYNTLDTIGWMAMLKGEEDIEQMVMELSRFFQLSLHKGEQIIPLKDELGIVSSYVKIEQLRNPGKFDVTYDIDPLLTRIQIPKIILQPVVENAIRHGIYEVKRHGQIQIRAYQKNNDIFLEVEDNGIGFQARHNHIPKNGYGLKNVEQRIKLEYGDEYGLIIKSENGAGTVVTVHIPFSDRTDDYEA